MGTKNQQSGGQNSADDDDDEKMTADDIRRLVVQTVNGTVEKTVGKAIGKLDIGKMVTDAVTPLLEQLKPGGEQQQGGGNNNQQNAALPPEVKKQIDDLARANKALQDKYDAAERAAKETAAKASRKEERDLLGAALRKAGLPEPLVAGAVAMLHADKGVLKRNDEGVVQWVQGDEALDVEKGVAGWLKTDEGKAYLPARQVSGSGAGRNQVMQPNGQRLSKDQEIEVALAALAGMPDFGPGTAGPGGSQ